MRCPSTVVPSGAITSDWSADPSPCSAHHLVVMLKWITLNWFTYTCPKLYHRGSLLPFGALRRQQEQQKAPICSPAALGLLLHSKVSL